MFAKRFFYVCAGLFLLTLAYHLGARNAGAQAGSTIVGYDARDGAMEQLVMTSTGDLWVRCRNSYDCTVSGWQGPPVYVGNFWDGSGPIPAKRETWGSVKARYR